MVSSRILKYACRRHVPRIASSQIGRPIPFVIKIVEVVNKSGLEKCYSNLTKVGDAVVL